MSKTILLTSSYPSANDIYKGGFIHTRVTLYKKYNLEVAVIKSNSSVTKIKSYCYEDVNVTEVPIEILHKYLMNLKPGKILLHFLQWPLMRSLSYIRKNCEFFIWIHGFEALGWYRRMYEIRFKKSYINRILSNTKQLMLLRKFIRKNRKYSTTYIFPSEWMRKITQYDTLTAIDKYYIIPNSVDTGIFCYDEKKTDLRKKILIIRPFNSKKYANDISVNTILLLKKMSFFKNLEFGIYGKGRYFKRLTKDIKEMKNVKLEERFLTHAEIKLQHRRYGVFLCPTRQDAQGVSMCEAMSSGLVPITSNNTAIPEFVIHHETGLLGNNHKELAERIRYLYDNPDIYSTISKKASESIREKCSPESTIKKEIEIINRIKN